jgi:hypothetical protein
VGVKFPHFQQIISMNLDDFKPIWHNKWAYLDRYSDSKVRTSSLNDWRKIEDLYNKVNEKNDKVVQLYWKLLKDWMNNSKCKEVWWVSSDDQLVYIYNGEGVITRHISQFIEELIPNPSRKGYKLSCVERKEINSIDSNIRTQRSRCAFLHNCFSLAVGNRLRQWFKQKEYCDYDNPNIVFKNSNRSYWVKVTSYNIELKRIDEIFD